MIFMGIGALIAILRAIGVDDGIPVTRRRRNTNTLKYASELGTLRFQT